MALKRVNPWLGIAADKPVNLFSNFSNYKHNIILDKCQNLTFKVYKGSTFNWNSQEQGVILGAFFYGYILTQVPGAVLAQKCGGKWIFGIGTLVTGILTCFTPAVAKLGKWQLFFLRLFEGIFEV